MQSALSQGLAGVQYAGLLQRITAASQSSDIQNRDNSMSSAITSTWYAAGVGDYTHFVLKSK
jgi:hypothetical protein